MRNISFMLTQPQIRAKTKRVTRRNGWKTLKVGDRLQGCEKCQGIKPGEKMVKLAEIVITDVRREQLRRMIDEPEYGRAEVIAEGFPEMTPEQFVTFFCESHKDVTPDSIITRIAFDYVADTQAK